MKTGIIYVYSTDNGLGVIKCSKKERFVFELKDWVSDRPPLPGLPVKFRPERSMARDVVIVKDRRVPA